MADFRAKRSSVIELLKKDISRGFIDVDVIVQGHKFKLRTLSEDDEVWADAFARTTNTMSMISSRKAPRLAASIMEIDGVPSSALFQYPDDMPEAIKKELDGNAIQRRYWVYDQMLYFLSEDTSRPFINELWAKFEELEKQRDEALGKIPN